MAEVRSRRALLLQRFFFFFMHNTIYSDDPLPLESLTMIPMIARSSRGHAWQRRSNSPKTLFTRPFSSEYRSPHSLVRPLPIRFLVKLSGNSLVAYRRHYCSNCRYRRANLRSSLPSMVNFLISDRLNTNIVSSRPNRCTFIPLEKY